MVELNITTLVAIAFVTSLGNGIGTPIGNWVFKKYIEPKMEIAHEKVSKPISISDVKIKRMLGK